MKLLLDENLPHRLRALIVGHDVYSVRFMRWNGIKNGELLSLAAGERFDALVTMDEAMQYEQNAETLPCAIVVLRAPSNTVKRLSKLVPELLVQLSSLSPKTIVYVG